MIAGKYHQISVYVINSDDKVYLENERFHPYESCGFRTVLEYLRRNMYYPNWGIFADIGGDIPNGRYFIRGRVLLACSKDFKAPVIEYPQEYEY